MSKRPGPVNLTRLRVMQAMLAVPALTLAACGGSTEAAAQGSPTASSLLTPTPACDDGDDDPTPAQTEGPYFTSNSPLRTSLVEAGMPGTRLTVSGRVLTTGCQGIAQASSISGRPTPPGSTTMQATGCGRVLTTQLYFPGEARNASDGIYSPELLLAVEEAGTARAGTFNFVLA